MARGLDLDIDLVIHYDLPHKNLDFFNTVVVEQVEWRKRRCHHINDRKRRIINK
uniref:Uncharacterized protein n=1 Tax=Candidatus Phytoplasma australasiaticum subsp. australasiaticum TaxID=2832407 RepID=A0A7S7G0M9_9MOLU|nr:hypothetical protein H7685_01105 ['Parthenium hysterophorus' phyllody phytoplasma]